MDIRKFFPVKGGATSRPSQIANKKEELPRPKTSKEPTTKKRRKAQILESDSDEDVLPPAKSLKSSSTAAVPAKEKKVKKRILESEDDNDDDIIESSSPEPPKRPRKEEARKKSPLKTLNGSTKRSPNKKVVSLKPISAMDFFSTRPVSRSDKVLLPQAAAKELATHDDPDFQLTLQQSQNLAPASPATKDTPKSGKKEDKQAEKLANKSKPLQIRSSEKPSQKEDKAMTQQNKPAQKEDKANKQQDKPSKKLGKKEDKSKPLEKKQIQKEDKVIKQQDKPSEKPAKKESKSKLATSEKPAKKEESTNHETETKPATPPKSKLLSPAAGEKPTAETTPKSDKKTNFLAYKRYLERDGPRALGSRKIPEAVPGCLSKKVFVITGVLDYIDRDEVKALIEQCGGKVTMSVSRNTNYLVTGRESGASKTDKAQKLGTTILDEDQFFQLLESKTGSKSDAGMPSPSKKKEDADAPKSLSARKKAEPKPKEVKMELDGPPEKKSAKVGPARVCENAAELWVDKYRPASSKQIIGQQGAKSNVVKLTAWLSNWHKNRANKPAKFSDDGAIFKAALLSGPPGIGKTTTAQLVCKELGYDCVEFNASDTRSKKSLHQEITELLSSQSLAAFAGGSLPQAVSKKHAVIMDEVDGMAGNEDRGGMQELIALIKSTQVPIICICNNRSHPKVLSLSRHCFDLRFSRPRTEQIRGAMMSVAFKEGIKVAPQALADLIESSNHDVRQVLHSLSLMAASQHAVSVESVKADIGRGIKDLKLGPFDVLRKVFASGQEKEAMSLSDKSDLFFHDYSIGPLFVQENYLQVVPHEVKGDKVAHLRLVSEAADSLADGDLVERQIRSQNSWSLLPVQAIFSSVVPGELLRGHLGGQINFPSWLGRNSTQGKNRRLTQQLQLHTRLRTSASCIDLALDYLPRGLRSQLLGPSLAEGDVSPTLELMQHYYLQRDDLDAICLLTQWPGSTPDPLQQLPTKVKSALTRAFNKEGFMVPYATMSLRNTKARAVAEEDMDGEAVAEEEDESEDDDLTKDAMIKVNKPSKAKKEDPDFEPGTSKGKGRGGSSKSSRGRKAK